MEKGKNMKVKFQLTCNKCLEILEQSEDIVECDEDNKPLFSDVMKIFGSEKFKKHKKCSICDNSELFSYDYYYSFKVNKIKRIETNKNFDI